MLRPFDTHQTTTLHLIALFEALKGVAAIAAGLGLLSLAHHDLQALAHALIGHFHWDPEAHYPRMLLDEAALLANTDLRQVVLLLAPIPPSVWPKPMDCGVTGPGLNGWRPFRVRSICRWKSATCCTAPPGSTPGCWH